MQLRGNILNFFSLKNFFLLMVALLYVAQVAFAQPPPPPPPPPGVSTSTAPAGAGTCPSTCGACTLASTCVSPCSWYDGGTSGVGSCTGSATGGTQQGGTTQQQVGQLGTIPEPSVTSIGDFYIAIKAVAQWVLVFGLILGVIFIIIGAISVLTSRGDSSSLTTGKQTITWAVVGVILLVLSYAMVNIIARFFGATGNVVAP